MNINTRLLNWFLGTLAGLTLVCFASIAVLLVLQVAKAL